MGEILQPTLHSNSSPLLLLHSNPRRRATTMLAAKAMAAKTLPSLLLPVFLSRRFSSATPYPLYYELISHRPPRHRRRRDPTTTSLETHAAEVGGGEVEKEENGEEKNPLDKSKRKYYRKRTKRMYGGWSDSDSDGGRSSRGDELVELQPEVVDFPRLHAREEELYFYDAFAFPWEKEKHYRMVYQLEKKYFPDQCLDKAFAADPGREEVVKERSGERRSRGGGEERDGEKRDGRGLIFFEEEDGEVGKEKKVGEDVANSGAMGKVSERKVEEFFKCLKKVPGAGDAGRMGANSGEPTLVSRKTGLPLRWDGPAGTVVLVDKPKGWTSFTVCGKLRRLVKVQKVGHAGTLDPMATGLLIVCVGKATKMVERYQGMFKRYSGVFRLGEATSTWDADSPVIQREPWEHIKDDDIKKAAATFCGEIWQVPPMFSAIKVGGERMYEKARRGETVELSPRRISIFQFDIERSLEDRQNLIFRVTCSKGTYIRSLCADFGKSLGSCAHLTALRRDLIGQYSADDAWDFQELQEQIPKSYL